MNINAKFEHLPDGYSYEILRGLGKRYGIALVNPTGKKVNLVGAYETPLSFKSSPDIIYSVGDVRDTLIKNSLGDGEDYYWHVHGCDQRTDKYLEAYAKNIGLISSSEDEELTIDDTWDVFTTGAINSSDVYIKKSDDGYMLGIQKRLDIDTFTESRFLFNRCPTEKMFWDAIKIEEIRSDFLWNIKTVGYTCWECGREVIHWLDADGDLAVKFDHLKEKFCGFCDSE